MISLFLGSDYHVNTFPTLALPVDPTTEQEVFVLHSAAPNLVRFFVVS
jgi:hypothetical protein